MNAGAMEAGGGACRACGSAAVARRWRVPERMLGRGGSFDYAECADCGALSLGEVPRDAAEFYPADYPPFGAVPARAARGAWQAWLLGCDQTSRVRRMRRLVPDRQARILEVGTGRSWLLQRLWEEGYRRLTGVDPQLPAGCAREEPFPLRVGTIADCEGGWDAILYDHVLEHVPQPREELRAAAARLAPGGRLIVRVPLADSWARRRYGTCWVQWDAPRHVWVPTRRAMGRIGEAASLRVTRVDEDSTNFQIWGSRLYRRGLPLATPLAGYRGGRRLLRAAPWLAASRAWVRGLNASGAGDQATFVLEKKGAMTMPEISTKVDGFPPARAEAARGAEARR